MGNRIKCINVKWFAISSVNKKKINENSAVKKIILPI
jgi:hypothetical protein